MRNPSVPPASTDASATPASAATPAGQESPPASHMISHLTTGATASPLQCPAPADNPTEDSRERFETFTRLLIGAALEASDELWVRLKLWQEQVLTAPLPARPERATDRLRFVLVGLIFEAEERGAARLRRMQRASMSQTAQLMKRVTPVGRRMMRGPLRPVGARLDHMLDSTSAQWQAARERWTLRGRVEEQQARLVARQAAASLSDELFNRLEHDRALQDLIQAIITQQGTGLATTAVESARERTQAADDWVERMVHGMLKRPAHEQRAGDHPADVAHSVPPIEASHSE
jgi:hypothetical protein